MNKKRQANAQMGDESNSIESIQEPRYKKRKPNARIEDSIYDVNAWKIRYIWPAAYARLWFAKLQSIMCDCTLNEIFLCFIDNKLEIMHVCLKKNKQSIRLMLTNPTWQWLCIMTYDSDRSITIVRDYSPYEFIQTYGLDMLQYQNIHNIDDIPNFNDYNWHKERSKLLILVCQEESIDVELSQCEFLKILSKMCVSRQTINIKMRYLKDIHQSMKQHMNDQFTMYIIVFYAFTSVGYATTSTEHLHPFTDIGYRFTVRTLRRHHIVDLLSPFQNYIAFNMYCKTEMLPFPLEVLPNTLLLDKQVIIQDIMESVLWRKLTTLFEDVCRDSGCLYLDIHILNALLLPSIQACVPISEWIFKDKTVFPNRYVIRDNFQCFGPVYLNFGFAINWISTYPQVLHFTGLPQEIIQIIFLYL
eukprot:9022_1